MPTVASQAGRAANSLPAKHLITVEAYHKMGEAGIFSPEARVELIEGIISPQAFPDLKLSLADLGWE